jgi:DNA polymerase III subunit delta
MIVVLTGSNTYTLQKSLKQFVADFVEKYGESIERFDGSEMESTDNVLDAVRSVSFLDPRKLVIVRDFSQSKALNEIIESIVAQTAESTDLLLVDPKLDKRTAVYKYLQKNCDVRRFDTVQGYELEKWFSAEAKSKNIKISNTNVAEIVGRVGLNQQQLAQELSKLTLVEGEITKAVIDDLIEPNPQSKVFDMLEALFSGDMAKAYELYKDQRSQGEEPQKLLAMITWQLQQLTLAVFAPSQSVEALTASGMSSYSAQKALHLAKKISKKDLKFYITELAEIDVQSKTNADIESALNVYFSEVTERIKN